MTASIETVAPAFVEMAHRIVWCSAATTAIDGRPRTRILHPIWEFDGTALTGWIATSPLSPKAADLEATPSIALSYWDPSHDTCSAECDAIWEESDEDRLAGWNRFVEVPAPVGYDPSIIPGWESPQSPGFGVLRLEPTRLRVMPGSVMLQGQGEVLSWRA